VSSERLTGSVRTVLSDEVREDLRIGSVRVRGREGTDEFVSFVAF
jgi:hypothetical protein